MRKFSFGLVVLSLLCMLQTGVSAQNIRSLNVSAATTSAFVTWTSGAADYFDVNVEDMYGTNVYSGTIYEKMVLISGLDTNTQYRLTVTGWHGGSQGATDSATFWTQGLGCAEYTGGGGTYTVGTPGTSTCSVMPITQGAQYSYVMHWIPRTQLTVPSAVTLTGIDFQYAYSQPMTHATNCSIYLGFTSTSDNSAGFVPFDSLTMVYEGPLNGQTVGWNHFDFNRGSLTYDGTRNMVIAIVNNSGSDDGSAYVWNYTTISSITRRVSGSTAYTPSAIRALDPMVAPNSTWRSNMRFTTGQCLRMAECAPPQVVDTAVSPYSADVIWAPGYQESSWDVDYKAASSSQWTSLQQNTSSTNETLLNLQPATTYEVRVTANCTDTTMSRSISFTTPCVPRAVPFTENFDSWTASTSAALGNCWNRLSNYTSGSSQYPYISTSYRHSGSNAVYLYSTATTYSTLILPYVNPTADSLMVSFWMYKGSASYAVEVGVMTDPTDNNTFTTIATVTPSAVSTWEHMEVALASYQGSGHYVALRSPNGLANSPYIDDVTLDYLPACLWPVDITFRDITADSCTMSWYSNGSAIGWVMEWADRPFTPGTGVGTQVNLYDTVYIFDQLHSNTTYHVYIYTDCGSDTSRTVHATFRTPCVAARLPLSENFDTWTASSTADIDPCWYRFSTYSSSSQYPYISTSYHHSGSNALYLYSTSSSYSYICLPYVATRADSLTLTFWIYKANSSYTHNMEVGVMTDPTDFSTYTRVRTITPQNLSTWEFYEIDLASYNGNGHYVTLLSPNSVYSYPYIDDLELYKTTTCRRSIAAHFSNITTTGADMTWTDTNYSGTYLIEYGPQGFSVGTGTYDMTYDTVYTFYNLSPSSIYDVYIYSLCSGDTSAPFRTTLQTRCGDISRNNMPWHYGFEDATGTGASASIHQCMTRGTNYTTAYPYTSTSYYAEGRYSLYFYSTSSYYSYLALPPMENTVTDLMVSFYTYMASSYTGFELGVMTDPTDYSTFTSIANITPASTGVWQPYNVSLANYNGNGRYIAFRVPAVNTSYFYLDDITVSLLPACSPVSNVQVSNVHGTSARMSWSLISGFATPSYYEIEIEETGTGNPITETDTINWHILSMLSPLTNYTARVRGVCDDGSYTDWDSARFSTGCLGGGWSTPSGRETTAQTGCPVNSSYGNTFSQTIFTAAELNAMGLSAGSINGCKITWNSGGSYDKKLSIFLDTTSATNFPSSSTSYWKRISSNNMVYSAVRSTRESGEIEYRFDNGFRWDGSHNVVMTIVVNQEGGSQSSSGFNAYSTNTRTGVTMYKYQDGTAFSLTSTPSAVSSTSAYRVNICFQMPCDSNASCAAPYVYAGNITDSTATMHWAPGYMEASWDVEYREQGTRTWTTAATAHSINEYTFTGLRANTHYEVRITPDCSISPDSLAAIATFLTNCAGSTLPFTENFDTWGTSATSTIPGCWFKLYSGTTAYPYGSTSYNHTAGATSGKSLYLYSQNTTYSAIVLPVMDAPIDSLHLTFWAFKPNTSYSHMMQVGVLDDPEDISTFTQVGPNLQCSQVGEWEAFGVSFSSYRGSGHNIAILSPNGQYSYPYIDDIEVRHTTDCELPNRCILTNITTTDASFSWNGHGIGSYVAEYGLRGFQPGTGAAIAAIAVSDDSVTITGLTPNTEYDFYVRAVCNSGDSSIWSAPLPFVTECDEISSLPYTYGFEDATIASSAGHISHCWTKGTNNTSTSYPYPSSTSHTGSRSLYTYATSSYYCYAALPLFQANVTDLMITFWYKRSSASYPGTVEVGVMTDPTDINTFTRVQTCTAATGTNWDIAQVILDSYTGTGRYIALRIPSGTTSYVYIDDITVDSAGTCPPPTQLTSTASMSTTTSAQIGWTENGNASQWTVEYGTTGFTIGQGTLIHTTSNPLTITGLSPSTDYQFVVRSICSNTDSSNYSATRGTFNTACDIIAHSQLPYTYGFEDAAGSGSSYQINRCWDKGASSTTTTAYPYPSNSYIHTGSYSLYMYGYQSSSIYCYAVLPEFADNINSLSISLWARKSSTGTSYSGHLIVGVITNPTNFSTFIPYDTLEFTTTTYSLDSVNFGNYTGAQGRICFHNNMLNTSYNSLYIDDITVYSSGNGCPMPSVRSTATHDQVTLTWNGTAGGNYEAAIKPVTAGSWPASTSVTTNSHTFTGLTPATLYDYRVRQICDATTQSSWYEGQIATQSIPCHDPSHPTLSSSTNVTATVRWTSGGYETSWIIHTFSSNSSRYDTVTTNPATISGLTAGTAYQVAVSAVCSSTQTSGWSDTLSFTTRTCDTPTSLSATANGITVTLSWNTPTTINNWEVEYGTSGFSHGSGTVVQANQNPTTISGLNPNTSYQFYVRSVCGTNFYSDWSTAASATTGNPSGADCDGVTNIQVNVSANNAGVSWTPGSNNNGNWIVEYGPRGFSHGSGQTRNATSPSTTLSNLTYGTDYDLYVRADCGSGNLSPWAGPTQFSIVCGGITGLTSQVAGTTVFLSWNAVTGASYEIEYGPRGFQQGSGQTTNSSSNGATLSGLNPTTEYTAYVRSLCGASAHSDWTSTNFTTGASGVQVCDPATDVTASRSGTSAVISFTPGANNTGNWEIEYGPEGFSHGSGTMVTGVTATLKQIDNLATAVTYQFYVRAVCSADNISPWSPPATLRIPSDGIQTVQLQGLAFRIYPNPADKTGSVTIAVNSSDEQTLTITLLDIMGRTVQQHRMLCSGNCDQQLPITSLPAGTYFVRLATPQASTIQKLIIK